MSLVPAFQTLATLPALPLPTTGVVAGLDSTPVARRLGALVGTLTTIESAVEAFLRDATGPGGLALVFGYSFLCAVLLPLPGELVLAVPLDLGWSPGGELAAVIAVASTAKAAGALVALAVARGATAAGPVARLVDALPRPGAGGGLTARLAGLADRYGYVGLAGSLAVPFAPDTAIIYAFGVVEPRRLPFAAAAFVGTTLRLGIVAGLASAVLTLV